MSVEVTKVFAPGSLLSFENLRIGTIYFAMSGGTKLFVYGVNRSCPKDMLEDHFAKIGAVSDVYITEKGYAFVTMADEGDAKAAVDELNGIRYLSAAVANC